MEEVGLRDRWIRHRVESKVKEVLQKELKG